MLTLQCLWCRHRNPAGEDVCNACGTPLYLKPCTHCDAANQRAAAHCRNCGEAFSFDFVAAAELERDLGDAIVTAGDTAPAETSQPLFPLPLCRPPTGLHR